MCLNSPELVERAQILRDRGTNRKAFREGRVSRYTWLDTGSAYAPNELACAFLWGQLERMDAIRTRRSMLWDCYADLLRPLADEGLVTLPTVPSYCGSNHPVFYLLLPTRQQRDGLIAHLKARGIDAAFHYLPLHTSPMGLRFTNSDTRLPVTESVSDRLVRLPFFHDLTEHQQVAVVEAVSNYLESAKPSRSASPA